MTATTVSTTTSNITATTTPKVLRPGLKAGAVAGVATSAFAVGVHAAGVPLEIQGEQIPALAFGQLTFMATLVGVGLAAVFARRANRARRAFVATTLVLTALSLVPDVTADATTATKLCLMASHVIAAAIVIPWLAGRLSD